MPCGGKAGPGPRSKPARCVRASRRRTRRRCRRPGDPPGRASCRRPVVRQPSRRPVPVVLRLQRRLGDRPPSTRTPTDGSTSMPRSAMPGPPCGGRRPVVSPPATCSAIRRGCPWSTRSSPWKTTWPAGSNPPWSDRNPTGSRGRSTATTPSSTAPCSTASSGGPWAPASPSTSRHTSGSRSASTSHSGSRHRTPTPCCPCGHRLRCAPRCSRPAPGCSSTPSASDCSMIPRPSTNRTFAQHPGQRPTWSPAPAIWHGCMPRASDRSTAYACWTPRAVPHSPAPARSGPTRSSANRPTSVMRC